MATTIQPYTNKYNQCAGVHMSHCFYFSILTIKWWFSVIQSFNNLREHPYISISISKYLRVKRTANICLAATFLIEKSGLNSKRDRCLVSVVAKFQKLGRLATPVV